MVRQVLNRRSVNSPALHQKANPSSIYRHSASDPMSMSSWSRKRSGRKTRLSSLLLASLSVLAVFVVASGNFTYHQLNEEAVAKPPQHLRTGSIYRAASTSLNTPSKRSEKGLSARHVLETLQAVLEERLTHQRSLLTQMNEIRKHRALSEGNDSEVQANERWTLNSSDETKEIITGSLERQSWRKTTISPQLNSSLLEALTQFNQGTATASQLSSSACQIPVATASNCQDDTNGYTVLALVTEPQNTAPSEANWQRTLFINCLRWLVDSEATEILILLPLRWANDLQNPPFQTSYGRRILSWSARADHPVRIVAATSLWAALEQIQPWVTVDGPVVWTRGDIPWRGNYNGIHQGYQQWKRRSASLVTASAWQFQFLNVSLWNESSSTTTVPTVHPIQDSAWPTASASPSLNAALPYLTQIQGLAPANRTTMHTPTTHAPILPDLTTATFHHAQYLCLLQDPLFAPLHESTDWDVARFGVAVWLSLMTPRRVQWMAATNRWFSNGMIAPGSFSSSSSLHQHEPLTREDMNWFDMYKHDGDNASANTSVETNDESSSDDATDILRLDGSKLFILSLLGGPPPLVVVSKEDGDDESVHPFHEQSVDDAQDVC